MAAANAWPNYSANKLLLVKIHHTRPDLRFASVVPGVSLAHRVALKKDKPETNTGTLGQVRSFYTKNQHM